MSDALEVTLAALLPASRRDTVRTRLEALQTLVLKWNRTFNLISRQDIHRLRQRHVLDSLLVADLLVGERVLDLGSGGGFPGLPLAIAEPAREFTLADRSERKVRFLRQAAIELGLDNVTVLQATAAQLASERAGCWHTVTARAVGDPLQVTRWAQPLAAAGGRLVLYAALPEVPPGAQVVLARDYRIPDIDGTRWVSVVEFAGAAADSHG